MRKRNRIVMMLTVFLLCILFSIPASAATKISKKTATLTIGQTLQLKVTGTKSKIKWSSNKKSVATVTSNGKVTAKKKGTATITAKVGKKSYKCKVTVINMKISNSKLSINIGEKKKLSVSGTNGRIKWSTNNKKIATVTSNGTVEAKRCGSCEIYAVVNKKKLVCKVNVGVEDPECFPNKRLKIGMATINSFEAKFVSFKLYNDYSRDIGNDVTYFFPYKYHIKITGNTTPLRSVSIRFCLLSDGKFPDMPANNYVSTVADENGNFVIDQDVKFGTYGEAIYIASVY